MDQGDFKSLSVTLGGRPYPLRVLPSDTQAIEKITVELNEKLIEFQKAYPSKDKQDCLAMLLLIYAVDLHKVKESGEAHSPDLSNALDELEKKLNDSLD